jgi:hypothetical protein
MLKELMPEIEINVLKCYLLYPNDCSELFEDVILPFLQGEFDLEYHRFCYNPISRESIQKARAILNDSCILLFAYVDGITLEYSYKLGLAHAYDSRVILLNFREDNFFDVPDCINFDFLMPVVNAIGDNELDSFLQDIGSVVFSCLSEDLMDFLYDKAVGLCEKLEKETSRVIDRVDKTTFLHRFSEDEITACSKDYSKSSKILLQKIVVDSKSLAIARHARNRIKKPLVEKSNSVVVVDVRMDNKLEVTAMADQSQRQQIFHAPVGVVASDHSQVSNFTQNNNANTAELLQLITTLRQTATTFPKEIQDELTIDIDDIETELQKNEPDRNPTKLKKRLLALATAGALIASPIAGMTDFANTAIDLAGKLNIELPIP